MNVSGIIAKFGEPVTLSRTSYDGYDKYGSRNAEYKTNSSITVARDYTVKTSSDRSNSQEIAVITTSEVLNGDEITFSDGTCLVASRVEPYMVSGSPIAYRITLS